METLLNTLAGLNISLEAKGSVLDIYDPDKRLTEELLSDIRRHKDELLSLLRDVAGSYAQVVIPQARAGETYTLSAAQRRLYFIYRFNPDSMAYNLPLFLRLEGPVDRQRISRTFEKLIARHEVLRTQFEMIGGEPRQRVLPNVEFELEYHKVDGDPSAAIGKFVRPFDPGKAPLVRAGLVELSVREFILMVDMHHIITDGISQSLIIKDFVAIYSDGELPVLPLQYKDFAEWEQGEEHQSAIAGQRAFWLERFAERPSVLSLPADHRRPLVKTYVGDLVHLEIGEEQTRVLRWIAAKEGATMFMVVLAIYAILLGELANEEDIVIGTPTAGREQADLEAMVGLFVNMLPIRMFPRGELNFREFLATVKADTLASFDNQSFPYESLLDELKMIRDASRNPLFDAVFAYQNFEQSDLKIPGLIIKPFTREHVIAKFDLTLLVFESQQGLSLKFEYSTELFTLSTIERFLSYFREIVASICLDADKPIAGIPMLQEQEEKQLLGLLRNTGMSYPREKTVHGLFMEQARRTPSAVAICCGQERITYDELDRQSSRLAALLRDKGVGPDAVVGLLMDRSIGVVTGMLGILKAGAGYLPIDPEYPQERIGFLIADSGTAILVSSRTLQDVDAYGLPVVYVEEATQGPDPEAAVFEGLPSNLCYVIYTSGTTGRPKGVMVEHHNVVRLFFNDAFPFHFGPNDTWTMFHSHCFDFSVWEIYGALLFGGRLIIIPRLLAIDTAGYLQVLKREGVTVLNQTPSAFYNLIREELSGPQGMPALRYVIFGGEALSPAQLKGWWNRYPGVKLVNMFGITETTVHVTYKEIGEYEIEHNISNIGKPIPTLSVYLLDRYGRLSPRGVIAELYVGGEGVARGYLGNAQLTAERFIANPYDPQERLYRSGDLARLLDSGEIEYLGRIDHQIQLRGFRIETGEIESRLLGYAGIGGAVVLLRERGGDKFLVAYYEANTPIDAGELRRHLSGRLPAYMIPSYFVQLERLPLTANGKLNRNALPEPSNDGDGEYTAPVDELQQRLSVIWAQVLGVARAGISQNYFSLGGDSIKAIKLIAAINRELGTSLTIPDLFEYQTIEEISRVIPDRWNKDTEWGMNSDVCNEIAELRRRTIEILPAGILEDIMDIYPMSAIQEGMFFHSLKSEGVYHDQMVHTVFYEQFDTVLIDRALTLLVEKHSILRTSFHLQYDTPLQFVHRTITPHSVHFDISENPADEQPCIIGDYLREDKKNVFRIEEPGLWRFVTFRLSPHRYCICFICHHAIIDGWSDASFNTELNNIYAALKRDPGFVPAPLKSSYRDFVIEQRVAARKSGIADFWINELADYKRFVFGARSVVPEKRKGSVALSGELRTRLQELSRTLDIPLKHLCFAAFVYTLGRFSYENDLTIGLITNNRPAVEDGDKILGCFLNTIPFRISIPEPVSWEDHIRLVHGKVMLLKKYDTLSLPEIVRIIGEPSFSGNPITDIIFNYIDFYIYDQFESYGRVSDAESGGEGQPDLPRLGGVDNNSLFCFTVNDTGGRLNIMSEYDTAFIDESMAADVTAVYERILHQMAAAPQAIVNREDLMVRETTNELLGLLRNTGVSYPREKTVHGLFMEQARRTPSAVAICCGQERITYDELDRQSSRLAALLRDKGVGPDAVVGLLMDRSIGVVTGMLGILKAGAGYLPIDPEYPQERIGFLIADSGTAILVSSRTLQDVDAYGLPVVYVEEATQGPDPEAAVFEGLPSNLCYVIYTSGTTGRPKGVMVEHHNVVRLFFNDAFPFHFGPNDTWTMFHSHCFDFSVWEIYGALLFGGRLIIIPRLLAIDTAGYLQVLKREGVTVLNQTPSAFYNLIREELSGPQGMPALRYVIFGGEALSPAQLKGWWNRYPGVKLVNMFGITETTVHVTYKEIGEYEIEHNISNIGKPIPTLSVYLLDRYGRLSPRGVIAELYVGGEGVARGYLGNAQLTAERFIANPYDPQERLYRSGDLARLLDSGEIEYLGRIDHQIQLRGFRIETGEIESRLLGYAGIGGAVVLLRERGGDKFLVAYYEANTPIDAGELRRHLSGRLPAYMIPSYFVQLERLPLTANGKLNRNALPEPSNDGDGGGKPPANEREEQILHIWQRVLARKKIGTDEDFFLVGGDSLKIIKLFTLLEQCYPGIVSVGNLFEYRTISSLAVYIDEKTTTARRPEIRKKTIIEL